MERRNFQVAVGVFLVVLGGCHSTRSGMNTNPAKAEVVSCKLTPRQLEARRRNLIPGLVERAVEVTELSDGIRLRFASDPELLSDLARVIAQEQDCCSFLRFGLTVEPNAGPVTLEITGPPGTGEMLKDLQGASSG